MEKKPSKEIFSVELKDAKGGRDLLAIQSRLQSVSVYIYSEVILISSVERISLFHFYAASCSELRNNVRRARLDQAMAAFTVPNQLLFLGSPVSRKRRRQLTVRSLATLYPRSVRWIRQRDITSPR